MITVDTRAMVERHLDRITLAPFNTGVSVFGSRPRRGINTFQSVEEFPLDVPGEPLVELAVEYHVPDIVDLTISVEQWRGLEFQRTVWCG